MNDELAAIAGKHEQLVGVLQEKYGIAKEEARHQVAEFKKIIEQLKKANAILVKSQRAFSVHKKNPIIQTVKAHVRLKRRK